jgi:hypothetical protein
MVNRNKRKNPYTECDKCFEFNEARKKNDIQTMLKLTNRLDLYSDIMNKKLIFASKDEQNEVIMNLTNFNNIYQFPGKCPFDYKPPLKRAIRVKYRMGCCSCGNKFICPADIPPTQFKPICMECYAGIGEMDYDPMDREE